MTAAVRDPQLDALARRLVNRHFAARPHQTTAEWAMAHRQLSSEASSLAGQWRSYPYQVEPMAALDDPAVERVVCVFPSQVGGKTELGLNWIGRMVHLDPGPMLVVEPTLPMAKTLSEERIDPMFRDTPPLRGLLAETGTKGKGNRLRYKRGDGWIVTVVGARSAAELAMRPIRGTWCDEVDRFPPNVGGEGSVTELVEARTKSFFDRKHLYTGTPVWDGFANSIWVLHQQGSGGEWMVPCPACGFEQPLTFGEVEDHFGLKWAPEAPGTVWYECANCHRAIEEDHKVAMNAAGRYVHARPERTMTRSFHFEAVASELVTWPALVAQFLQVKGIPDKLQPFVNTVRAMPFRVPGADFAMEGLLARRLPPSETGGVPDWVGVLVLVVDVQHTRLEVAWVGWGAGERCWMRIRRIEGDTTTLESAAWKDLDAVLQAPLPHDAGGEIKPRVIGIDIGDQAEVVSEYVRTRRRFQVRALRGIDSDTQKDVVRPSRKANKYGVPLWLHNNRVTKTALFKRLSRKTEPGPAHIAFDAEMTDEMIEQFLAERPVRHHHRLVYERIAGRRNEAIDLWCMALAALYIAGPVVRDRLERAPARRPPPTAPPDPAAEADGGPTVAEAPPARRRRHRRGNWLNRWRT